MKLWSLQAAALLTKSKSVFLSKQAQVEIKTLYKILVFYVHKIISIITKLKVYLRTVTGNTHELEAGLAGVLESKHPEVWI